MVNATQSAVASTSEPGHPERRANTTQSRSLTDQLKDASRSEHKLSDGLVAARLLVTATNKRLWAEAVTAFWYIFSALETALEDRGPEIGGAETLLKLLARVKRTQAFETDLQTYYGSNWRRKAAPQLPAVQLYLERLAMIKETDPLLLIAHAYTQHMAILAGGQILRRSVRSSLQLGPDEPGTAIFDLQEDSKKLRAEYKEVINSLEHSLTREEVKKLLDEHRLVFQLNNQVIRSFPVTTQGVLAGIVKLLPTEVLLLLVSVSLALLLMYITRGWIVMAPDATDFQDPDAVIA